MAYNQKITREEHPDYRALSDSVAYTADFGNSVMRREIAEELIHNAIRVIEDGERLSATTLGGFVTHFRLSDFERL